MSYPQSLINWLNSLDSSVDWDSVHIDDLEPIIIHTINKVGYMKLDELILWADDSSKIDRIYNIVLE